MKKQKTIKAWAIILKNVQTGKDSLFMRDGMDSRRWARITRTKKQIKELYPEHKPLRVEIKIL